MTLQNNLKAFKDYINYKAIIIGLIVFSVSIFILNSFIKEVFIKFYL